MRGAAWLVRRLSMCAAVVGLAAPLSACDSTKPTPVTTTVATSAATSAPATTTISLGVITSNRYSGQVNTGQGGGGGQTTIDLSLYFNLPGAASTASLRRPAAVDYEVTGGYTMGNGMTGSVTGTLDGTPNDGTFTGVLTAFLGDCVASRNYHGHVSLANLNWTPGDNINDCGGRTPLVSSFNLNDSPDAPTTSSMPNSTTTTAASTTTVPVSTTTVASTTTGVFCVADFDPAAVELPPTFNQGLQVVFTVNSCTATPTRAKFVHEGEWIFGIGSEWDEDEWFTFDISEGPFDLFFSYNVDQNFTSSSRLGQIEVIVEFPGGIQNHYVFPINQKGTAPGS